MRHTGFLTSIAAALAFAPMAVAQEIADSAVDDFASANAILDTSIPFAPDARESQQNLRGAFGWATFQEGFADTVYFRFDPDGYARFSPSPRLDVDVFEVTCVPGTLACVAQKGALSLHLTATGNVTLAFDEIRDTDRLMLFDGANHLALPDGFRGPLAPQFEAALSKGGDIEVYRGDMQISKTSLKGLKPAVTYLRWIAARQSMAAFPVNWFGTDADGTVSQTTGLAPAVDQDIDTVAPGSQYADLNEDSELSDLRQELETLRKMLLTDATPAPEPAPVLDLAPDPAGELSFLQSEIENLTAELTRMKQQTTVVEPAPAGRFPDPIEPTNWRQAAVQPATPDPMPAEALPEEVKHLQYLVSEMGLSPKTALVLMQFIRPEADTAEVPDELSRTYHDSLAASILEDLEAELDASLANMAQPDMAPMVQPEPVKPVDPPAAAKKTDSIVQMPVDDQIQAPAPAADTPSDSEKMPDPKPEPAQPVAERVAIDDYQPLADYLKMAIGE